MTVMAHARYETNADLIVACFELGYLRDDWSTCDPTYGIGIFWNKRRPAHLTATDLDPDKSPTGVSVDACRLPYRAASFDSVVIDGPYKLNGTPDPALDGRYGVHVRASRHARMGLLHAMLAEGARVLGGGYLLFKCQDQVNGGKVRWQTIEFTSHAASLGLGLVDRLDMESYRAQPDGTKQVHARRNASSMLVFQRGWDWS